MSHIYRIAIKNGKETKYQAVAQCKHHILLFITFWTDEKTYYGNKLLELFREHKQDWDKRYGFPEVIDKCRSEF